MKKYDAIIIGAGQAGTPLARKLAKAGWRTALVERRKIGGTCVNDGCTPTKTMIGAAREAYMAGRAQRFGIPSGLSQIDLRKVKARKDEIVDQAVDGLTKSVGSTKNLDYIGGQAVFSGMKTIEVNGETLQADNIFINTGARPGIPDIEGLDTVPYLTSTTILDLTETPKHLCILGAGYVAMEMGQMFRRFGAQVTLLEKNTRILGKEDEDVAAEIHKIFEEDGITICCGAELQKVSTSNDQILLELNGRQLTCSHLLIAAGRTPNTGDLGLDKTGLRTTGNGIIPVNEKLETGVPGIYAMGDVKGGPAFTHISYNDYIIISKNILEQQQRTIRDRPVPYCMFTDPELGRIGLTEHEAREQGKNVLVAKIPMTKVARGVESGDTRGLMKAVVDKDSGLILGAAILSVAGGEIMSVVQMAMMGGLRYDQLRDGVFAHPTFSESLNNLFMSIEP
ncbi:mercuric reductase [Chitinophaga sp. NPDC101104]|uniref:mercuric reductase n=1 Tax=Chitinophaga sp. NPDC101104 TaxID=3390561 RepID=UPI003CFDCA4E